MRIVVEIWVILLLIIVCNIDTFAKQKVDNQTFTKITNQMKLDSNKYAILYFHSNGSCEYCIEEILSQLNCISERKMENFKIACFVYGNREIEIKSFRKNYSRIGTIFLNSVSYEEKLGLKKDTKIAVVGGTGDIIIELSQKEAVAFKLCDNIDMLLR